MTDNRQTKQNFIWKLHFLYLIKWGSQGLFIRWIFSPVYGGGPGMNMGMFGGGAGMVDRSGYGGYGYASTCPEGVNQNTALLSKQFVIKLYI